MKEEYIYSPETNAFYSTGMKELYEKSGTWPEKYVHITEELWRDLMEGQSKGKDITADSKGYPVLTERAPPSKEMLIKSAEREKSRLLAEATAAIAPLNDALEEDMATDEELKQLKAWKTYRVMLNRVDVSTAPDINWPATP